MTRTPEENALDEMIEEERREAADEVVQNIPGFVANDFMEYEDWAVWAAPVMTENSGKFAVEYLPEIHEAAERALNRRMASDSLPRFTRALRTLVPDMAPDAVVYDVNGDDGGRDINCPNTILTAARIERDRPVDGFLTRPVAKNWLREFILNDEIETAKADISEGDLKALEEAGWRVGHDPKGALHDAVLVHDELERVWPLTDIPGAFRDIGVPVPGESDTPGMGL